MKKAHLSLFAGLFISLTLNHVAYGKTYPNELKIHITRPKYRISWKSPRALLYTTVKNSLKDDYAPIGHFAVELNCATPNKYGVNHILTGMTTSISGETRDAVIKKKLGLGSIAYYNFKGMIESSDHVIERLNYAKNDGRLITVTIPTSASRCQMAMQFMEKWIDHASYSVYGGNKDFMAGEGAGCADFALEFFRAATSVQPKEDLFAKVLIPNELIGDETKKVRPLKILLKGGKWAESSENATLYVTPDTNKTIDYIYNDTLAVDEEYTYIRHLKINDSDGILPNEESTRFKNLIAAKAESMPPYEVNEYKFKFTYPQTESTLESWNRISVKPNQIIPN